MGKLGVSIKLLTDAKYCRTREAYSDRSDPTCTFKDTVSAASVIAARLCRVRAACQAEQANKAENLSAQFGADHIFLWSRSLYPFFILLLVR